MKIDKRVLSQFIDTVEIYAHKHGRHTLPWRKTNNPYRIWISEVMLQQTQVDRVIPKYEAFLREFPHIRVLADAPPKDVLVLWSGLGYNRRARFLHQGARHIVTVHSGNIPHDVALLQAIPGVGEYTANAIRAFAFDKEALLLETNIRTALLYEYFPQEDTVDDAKLKNVLRRLNEHIESPRAWYWALMDYGAYIKKTHGNHSVRSKVYVKQSAFEGSNRQVRGAITRTLLKASNPLSQNALAQQTGFEQGRIKTAIEGLEKEGMILRKNRSWSIA